MHGPVRGPRLTPWFVALVGGPGSGPAGPTMSHRMKITLTDSTLAELRSAAKDRGEPMARLATRLVSTGLSGSNREQEPPRVRAGDAERPDLGADRRAPWLEPFEGEQEWRRDMWGAIVALHGRYPRDLGHLKDGWWEHTAHVEMLCALVVWRDWIDQADDPRDELLFHAQLEDYSRALRQEGGGVSATWQPDAPPTEWA